MNNFFAQPIKLGNITLKNRVFLAPLAGVTNIPMRRICQEFGAGLTYVEMIATNALNYQNKNTIKLLERHPSEEILGIQIVGPSIESLGNSLKKLEPMPFDTIDINMGCSVKKIISRNSGSAMLKDPEYISNVFSELRKITTKPLSSKIRLGFSKEEMNVSKICEILAKKQLDMFTIHGRTASDKYSTPIDYQEIQTGILAGRKTATRPIVTVGNGDIFDFKSAEKMQKNTDCDAIMIGRGALGNPWIFKEILTGKPAEPTLDEWHDVLQRYISYIIESFGDDKKSTVHSRKSLIWFVKGFPKTHVIREKICHIESLGEAQELFRQYARQYPKDLIRRCVRPTPPENLI